VRKHVAIAIGTLALTAGLAASGCTGDSNAEAESPVDITMLRAELKERFGTPPNEAPWYRHITAVNWANGQLEITTRLSPEEYEGSDELRGWICGEPLKLAFEQQAEPDTIDLIAAVFGAGGVGLGYCG
jgi:hypothetical protein